MTANPTVYDMNNLLLFIDEHTETLRGVLVHSGNIIKSKRLYFSG
jgi:hypothetical protein